MSMVKQVCLHIKLMAPHDVATTKLSEPKTAPLPGTVAFGEIS